MRPAGRLRLRMWLEEQIQSGKYPGVRWLDQSEKVFQIPWKHAARHSWSIDRDATLFRSWAMHTGRYHPDKHRADPKTWKANFRCALNSLPDVCELRERSRKSGSDAFRVYKMLPIAHARKKGSVGQQAKSSSEHQQRQPWQPASTTSSCTDDASPSIQSQDTWEQDQDQAGSELLEHFSSADPTSDLTWVQRGWRSHLLWDNWDAQSHGPHQSWGCHRRAACISSFDDNFVSFHEDNFRDLWASNCSKETSDCFLHQQTLLL
ncbi:interferon regulatory factor 2-like isoform X2 [Nerophis ophidion]|uniref:interferon regulatory factor 2-like isoform X2 n=1 Tax=Nerophis ophidion TaxID=159077 RepID=UPI002ADF2A90|nr:interferon regulatory factor 2-like isoform X2 [Nerophis ophidion]